ncbi:MAG: short-chain dehydrogenase [Deltaproteobacteria bacterium HGW-Deltaproteobacteria-14]|jgi:NAD(P)-dependent dehydrogenase (short-subunit alcohol dehydrogenase family)|nr:MAG: short-chain dehydrogenase [Deltaproteobacteria bacterium HGW-Deltaproteobacteria-14]
MQLADHAILITGASAGLGRALALELARRGARLALVARGEAALDAVVAEIRAAGGVAHGIAADVGDKDAVYAIAGTAAALVGDIDAVVHNASTLGPTPLRMLGDTACEDLERVLAVNLVGPFRLTKALVGPMLLRGRGLVVHVSSDAATEAYPAWGAYGASKAALDHLERIWAAELDGTGVRFLGVDPGEMDTAMHAAAIPDADRASLARPAEVARAVVAMMAADDLPSGARLAAGAFAVTS